MIFIQILVIETKTNEKLFPVIHIWNLHDTNQLKQSSCLLHNVFPVSIARSDNCVIISGWYWELIKTRHVNAST